MIDNLNRYYTPIELCEYVVNKTLELFPNISEIIEPAVGSGNFINAIKNTGLPHEFYDLYPNCEQAIEQDFLTLELPYDINRAFISNIPFGSGFNLGRAFVKKAASMGGVVSFILPAQQYNKNLLFPNIKLVYSQLLKGVDFILPDGKTVKLSCCFNIYDTTTPEPVKTFPYFDRCFDIKKVQKSKNNYEGYKYYITGYGSGAGKLYDYIHNEDMFAINIKDNTVSYGMLRSLAGLLRQQIINKSYTSVRRIALWDVKNAFNILLEKYFENINHQNSN